MNITADISMYPLDEAYEQPILAFIENLRRQPEVEVHTNAMSTQLYGAYDDVMRLLQTEMKAAFENPEAVIMVVKFLNRDRRQALESEG
jgi:uncharacterized protein YqgV (UPF0045/DUF77 family)